MATGRATRQNAKKAPHGHRSSIVALDHISMPVRRLKEARRFYQAALGALGMKINLDVSSAFGFGSRNQKIFWISRHRRAGGGGHYAFRVSARAAADAFRAAALNPLFLAENGLAGVGELWGRT